MTKSATASDKAANFEDLKLSESMTTNGHFVDSRVTVRFFKDGSVNLIQDYFDPESTMVVGLDQRAVDKLLTLLWNDPDDPLAVKMKRLEAALESSTPDESLKALEMAVEKLKPLAKMHDSGIAVYEAVLKLIAQTKAAQGEPKEMRTE